MTDIGAVTTAINAYKATAAGNAGGVGARDEAESMGPSFAALVESGFDKFVGAQRHSENMAAQAVLGKAELADVVEAVNNAEASLDLFLATRNRMIQAYEDILRMPV